MLLSKFLKRKNSTSSIAQLKKVHVSYLLVLALPILLALLWYPSLSQGYLNDHLWQKKLSSLELQQRKLNSKLMALEQGIGLTQYNWLNWRVEKVKEENEPAILSVTLHLSGKAQYQEWQNVLDDIAEKYTLMPIKVEFIWQLNNLLDASFTFNLTNTSFRESLLPIPLRTFKPWPQGITVSSAVFLNDKWHARLQGVGEEISLAEGIWLPELAATLVKLDKKGALFRQQYISKDKAAQEKWVPYAFHSDKLQQTQSQNFSHQLTALVGDK